MQNFQLVVDLQIDSEETARAFATALSMTMKVTAGTAVDCSASPGARVILGKTTISTAEDFRPNRNPQD